MAAVEQSAYVLGSPLELAYAEDVHQLANINEALRIFTQQHESLPSGDERASSVLKLVKGLRTEAGQGLSANTLLDVIDFHAAQQLWFFGTAAEQENRELNQRKEFAARQQVFKDIDLYDQVSGGNTQAYKQLLEQFHSARVLVKNPSGLLALEDSLDRRNLGRMLATHRLLKALKISGFTWSRLASVGDAKQDVILPREGRDYQSISFYIQPALKNTEETNLEQHNGTLLVNMQYDGSVAEPFTMPEEERLMLHREVSLMQGKKLGGFLTKASQ